MLSVGSPRRVYSQLHAPHRRRLVFKLPKSAHFCLSRLKFSDQSLRNQILDLKGTPKPEQNALLDSFLTITSTKTELESSSFLSTLDMDPVVTSQSGGTLISPGGSRVSLPFETVGESIMTALGSGSPTVEGSTKGGLGRGGEVFSDFKRFVSFNLRRDTQPPS